MKVINGTEIGIEKEARKTKVWWVTLTVQKFTRLRKKQGCSKILFVPIVPFHLSKITAPRHM